MLTRPRSTFTLHVDGTDRPVTLPSDAVVEFMAAIQSAEFLVRLTKHTGPLSVLVALYNPQAMSVDLAEAAFCA